MGTLIKFELKKLYMSRVNQIVFLGTCLCVLISMIVSVAQARIYDKEGNLVLGLNAVKTWKTIIKELEEPLTDERVGELLQEVLTLRENGKNPDNAEQMENILYSYYLPRQELFSLIRAVYYDSDMERWGENHNILNIPLEQREDFYQARTKQILNALETGREDWKYTEAEKMFWQKKNEKIKTPIYYGYADGWKWSIQSLGYFIIPIIALSIMLARIYAGEYECGTEHIILATKYGKTKIIAAKNLAALIFGGIYLFIMIGIYLGVLFLTLGTDGGGVPIQNYRIDIVYPLTFLQAVLLDFGLCLAISFGIMAFILFLSARMKNSLPVLAISTVVIWGGMFLNRSYTNGVYNHIIDLLPYQAIDKFPFDMYSYPFGNLVLDYPTMVYVVYLTLGAVLIFFAGRAFRRCEVE